MNLSSYIKDRGLTDEQFGQEAGLHKSAVSRYRRGLVKPGWTAMTRMYVATKGAVTPNDFFVLPQEHEAPDEQEVSSALSVPSLPEQEGDVE
ncbi:hypothetical protein [Azospirillum aestuarii]|uniref:hypothetical protein n=1 Tax=Azospirillum aestuarii TaxID=2802052 RepID=UPI004055104A